MEFIRRNWFKICIIAVLVIGAISFDITYKQGIEDRRSEEITARETKKFADHKDYINKQKAACYETYNKEKKNWNNTQAPAYDEEEDVCRVNYSSPSYWKGTVCKDELPDKDTPVDSNLFRYEVRQTLLCTNGLIEKEF